MLISDLEILILLGRELPLELCSLATNGTQEIHDYGCSPFKSAFVRCKNYTAVPSRLCKITLTKFSILSLIFIVTCSNCGHRPPLTPLFRVEIGRLVFPFYRRGQGGLTELRSSPYKKIMLDQKCCARIFVLLPSTPGRCWCEPPRYDLYSCACASCRNPSAHSRHRACTDRSGDR